MKGKEGKDVKVWGKWKGEGRDGKGKGEGWLDLDICRGAPKFLVTPLNVAQ